MKLDQEKSKKGDQKVEKKEPKLIVEMLKFEQEEKKGEVKVEEKPFVLKEVDFEKISLVLTFLWKARPQRSHENGL